MEKPREMIVVNEETGEVLAWYTDGQDSIVKDYIDSGVKIFCNYTDKDYIVRLYDGKLYLDLSTVE